jgi:hypothetical protein
MADSKDPIHFQSDDAPWSDYSGWYPDEMMRSMRAKRLIGGHVRQRGVILWTA